MIVQNTKEFVEAAKQLVPTTNVIYIDQDMISKEIEQNKPFQDVKKVPGIFKMHIIHCTGNNVMMWKNANFVACPAHIKIQSKENEIVTSEIRNCVTTKSLAYRVGDWVVVSYAEEEYPGEITSVFKEELVVSVMHRAETFFKWPSRIDEIPCLRKCHQKN